MSGVYNYTKPNEKAFFRTLTDFIQNKDKKTRVEEQILKKIDGGKCEIRPSIPLNPIEIQIRQIATVSSSYFNNAYLYEDYLSYQSKSKVLDTTIFFYVNGDPKFNKNMKNKLIEICNIVMPTGTGFRVNKIESSALIPEMNEISNDMEDLKGLINYVNSNEFEISSDEKYLNIENLPDGFYDDLVFLINKCHLLGIYEGVQVFSRKLLENLLVDILRKKYNMKKVNLFYDTKSRRFQGFSILLNNFKDNLDDFKMYSGALNHNFVDKIKKFKVYGDSSAHTLELNVKKEDLDIGDLEYIVNHLISIYNKI